MTPRANHVTEEAAEVMRADTPDDPVPLPPDHLACAAYGIAVPDPDHRAITVAGIAPMAPVGRQLPAQANRARYGRCADCAALGVQAALYVEERPLLVGRLGNIAVQRIESVLFGLQVLGRPAPGDLAFLLPRMHPPSHLLRFANPLTLTTGLCSPWPWAHVTMSQRQALRAAYADVLADRVALHEPPVQVRCPSGGCRLCGLSAIERSAIEVRRRGGVELTAAAIWEQTNNHGHLCPVCLPVAKDVGAFGPATTARAVIEHLDRTSKANAQRLRALLDSGVAVPLIAWADNPNRTPNAQPWGHLRRVLDRLGNYRLAVGALAPGTVENPDH